jgi:pilus assembly protein CpaC
MMQIGTPQQVMLEVKVAEISKTLLEKLGLDVSAERVGGDWRYSVISSFLAGNAGGVLGFVQGANAIKLDADKRDGLFRVLAEPNIVSISGQEASFLAGGKLFIPVARGDAGGGGGVTLEEREFGVGVRFTPTVLDGDLINLRVAPEVSELSQTGTSFTTANSGATAILPSFTTRRAQTTVQLRDGQSFAIAGLIRNNVSESIRRFPVLGEVPILGALFRSSEFQSDRTELMFIVTPRLVKPLPADHRTPVDNWIPPSRSQFFLEGRLEGSGRGDVGMGPPTGNGASETPPLGQPSSTQPAPAAAGSAGGFQLK